MDLDSQEQASRPSRRSRRLVGEVRYRSAPNCLTCFETAHQPTSQSVSKSVDAGIPTTPIMPPTTSNSSNTSPNASNTSRGRNAVAVDSPNKEPRRVPNSEPPEYIMKIPDGVREGQKFPATIAGQRVMFTCPPNGRPRMLVRLEPDRRPRPARSSGEERVEAIVPRGVQPGQTFPLTVGGTRVVVMCPANTREGERVRFNLPPALMRRTTKEASNHARVKLAYNKDGWTRTIRVSDMKVRIIILRELLPS